MLVNQINHLVFIQYFFGLIVWFFSLYILEKYLVFFTKINSSQRNYFLCYYILLSMAAIIRIFTNIFPFTLDSEVYLSAAEGIDRNNKFFFFGAFVYSTLIYFIKSVTFNNHYAILFFNNFIFIIALIDLLFLIPRNKIKSLRPWYIFLLVYPSIYWFIPNILREALFFFCIVKVLKYSLIIIKTDRFIYNFLLLILFSVLCIALRPQVLPILYAWISFIFFKRSILSFILIILFGFGLLSNDFITSEYLTKVSFEYLEAKKTEGATSIPTIAFEENIIPTNIYEVITLAPYLVFRFLFAPFPWELSNLRYLFAFLDSTLMLLLFITLFWVIIRGYVYNWDIILFSFLFIIVLGIFEIAFSGAVRHRMPFVLIMSTLLLNLPTVSSQKEIILHE